MKSMKLALLFLVFCLFGMASSGYAWTITRTSGPYLTVDTANSYTCNYVSFSIQNDTGSPQSNVWGFLDFGGGNACGVTLAPLEDGYYELGDFAVGQTR